MDNEFVMQCPACGKSLPPDAVYCLACGRRLPKPDAPSAGIAPAHVGKTCPYCQTPLKPHDQAVVCPQCGMPHHRDCWEDNGGCTTYGCVNGVAHQAQLPPPNPAFHGLDHIDLTLEPLPMPEKDDHAIWTPSPFTVALAILVLFTMAFILFQLSR